MHYKKRISWENNYIMINNLILKYNYLNIDIRFWLYCPPLVFDFTVFDFENAPDDPCVYCLKLRLALDR